MAVDPNATHPVEYIDVEEIARLAELGGLPWNGWLDRLGRDGTMENYGSSGTQSAAKILVPGHLVITDEEGLITRSSFTHTGGLHAALYSFVGQDPDNNPDTVELGGLTVEGFRGEGMRGRNALTDDSGELVGEKQMAVSFESYDEETKIEVDTMGIGYIMMSTTDESGYHEAPMFFNYSELTSEPTVGMHVELVEINDASREYFRETPVYYSESEAGALKAKFGYDPTVIPDEGGSILYNAIDLGFMKVTEMLNATYPNSLATFPRTPPLKIQPGDISAIPASEQEEVAQVGQIQDAESYSVATASDALEMGGAGMASMGSSASISGGSGGGSAY